MTLLAAYLITIVVKDTLNEVLAKNFWKALKKTFCDVEDDHLPHFLVLFCKAL